MHPAFRARPCVSAAAFAALAFLVLPSAPAADRAPEPRAAASTLDEAIIAEARSDRSEIMKNLQYLSDTIGGRLTGSKALEKANNWTADRMKDYGLENVRLEPWEIPMGWERGRATMRLVEPGGGRDLLIASAGWSPGTKGKVTGPVVIVNARTKDELQKFKGKLKDAIVLTRPPTTVAPVTDLRYGPGGAPGKKDAKKDGAKTDEVPKKGESKKDEQPVSFLQPPRGGVDITEFAKAEGVACICSDAGKPHGLLVTTGGWPTDRAAAEARVPRVYMAHEHYAMLYRLAGDEKATVRAEVEIVNTFVPGPVTVYNTVGEVRGSEKPDEFVVVGAHLDSWELATGTTDNGTGSCVVLETARVVAALAKEGNRPKRTIRFVLFTGEEQGLHGSRQYVQKHKAELDKHSAALVHDTGTGKVLGFGMQGRQSCMDVLAPQLESLKQVDGWTGLNIRNMGGTDHLPFNSAGVPGFACLQDMDEYRLTHHTQSDTFDKAKEPNLRQGVQVMAVTATRIANLPELLPRK
ncbi:MAG TPA: M20/M25/M40 family metallo-hydrolase [Gemmata sp.]|nr:M20/M25/M40 family metallo-hydrolase [Gemmata sp.]